MNNNPYGKLTLIKSNNDVQWNNNGIEQSSDDRRSRDDDWSRSRVGDDERVDRVTTNEQIW